MQFNSIEFDSSQKFSENLKYKSNVIFFANFKYVNASNWISTLSATDYCLIRIKENFCGAA